LIFGKSLAYVISSKYFAGGVLLAITLLFAATLLAIPWQLYLILYFTLVLGLTFLISPDWGGYLLIFVSPIVGNRIGFMNPSIEHSPLNTIPVSAILLLGIILVFGMQKAAKIKESRPGYKPLQIATYIFTSYVIFTIYWSGHFFNSLMALVVFIYNILLFLYIYSMINNEKMHRKCINFFIAAGVATGILAIVSIELRPQFVLEESFLGSSEFVDVKIS
jgi:hypothetical protein